LSYHDLVLECSASTVHTGSNGQPGEEFSCYASGGNEDYTWVLPGIVQRDTSYTEDYATQAFTVEVNSAVDFPTDSTITIEVQDGRGTTASVEIELLPPAIIVEELYTVGNE
jgi:hypothetical protein